LTTQLASLRWSMPTRTGKTIAGLSGGKKGRIEAAADV
jgi:hypothetical protein